MLAIIAAAVIFVVGGRYFGETPGDYGLIRPTAYTAESFRISSVSAGSSLADAGIRPQQMAHWAHWDFQTRATVLAPFAGSSVDLQTSDGRVVRLVAHAADRWNSPAVLTIVRLSFLVVAGFLALRRWERRAVRSLVYFLSSFGIALGLPNSNPVISSGFSYLVFDYGSVVLLGCAGAAAADFSAYFSGIPSRNELWVARAAIAVVIVANIAGVPIQLLSVGSNRPLGVSQISLILVPFALALAALVIGFLEARGPERSRRLWIALILGIGLLGPVIDVSVTAVFGYQSTVDQVTLLTVTLIPLGLAYVILRHRLIDVGFVLNQAAIYAGVSIVVVGVVVIVEALLSQYVTNVSHITSTSVQLAVALGLGISINAIHKRVEQVVDRAFFRERYAAEAALETFATDAGFITDPLTLLERCTDEVERHARASAVGIWLNDKAGVYTFRAGDFAPQNVVDPNDPAIVAMRARRVTVNLDDVDSGLPGVLAFPMLSGGELLGVLVCGGKRNEEDYAPDERRTIGQVAASVGHAWSALRVKELERELGRVTSSI